MEEFVIQTWKDYLLIDIENFWLHFHALPTLVAGSRGLMVESQTHNWKVARSSLGPAGIVGGGSECTALSPPSIPRRGALEQDTEPPTAPRAPQHKRLPTAPWVCSRFVCVQCCVCALGWVNVEHEFRVWVTLLGCMSLSLQLIQKVALV